MEHIRLSTPADIPAMRELWALAFGDSGPYVDNFFDNYYQPGRMIVLEENGLVRAMTAWFDTAFILPEAGTYRAAYLYAVATHPGCRGKGLAGRLLAWADDHFRTLDIPVVTTVPAEPSLHNFFGANGFRECFSHDERMAPPPLPGPAPFALEILSPEDYGSLRETLLAGTPHIFFPRDALVYQQGCCRISGGGLYTARTEDGPVLLCAEGMADGTLLLKELLGQPSACDTLLHHLSKLLPDFSGIYRIPGNIVPFGMVKYLEKIPSKHWYFGPSAYLGLAFD